MVTFLLKINTQMCVRAHTHMRTHQIVPVVFFLAHMPLSILKGAGKAVFSVQEGCEHLSFYLP